MSAPLNHGQALSIASAVVDEFELSIDEKSMSLIADGLGIASDALSPSESWLRESNNAHESRNRKIALLEELITRYDHETNENDGLTDQGHCLSYSHHFLKKNYEIDLYSLVEGLKKLLNVERRLDAYLPVYAMPNNRPTTAKNEGAEHIYEILRENNVSTWDACKIISEMLIRAGIEDKARNKVQRALYDKLRRI